MDDTSRSSLALLCQKRLERYVQHSPDVRLPLPFLEAVSQITQIVLRNRFKGRFERLQRNRQIRPKLTLAEYVDLVISYWVIEYERIHRLEYRDSTEWARLYIVLVNSARQMLQRYPQNSAAREPEDLAQWACEKTFFEGSYPFDVPFMAWVVTILKNQVLLSSRSKDTLDKPHQAIDGIDWAPDLESNRFAPVPQLSDVTAGREFERIEDRDILNRAIKKLNSPAQQKVIKLTYFEELDDATIARQLGKSVGAIQTMKSRALDNLSRIVWD